MKSALLLLSSGLDSAAQLVLAGDFKVVAALTIDYGQKSAVNEIEQAKKISQYFKIKHFVHKITVYQNLINSESSLLSDSEIPNPHSLDDHNHTKQTAKQVWVPNRNGIFIAIAAALAESLNIDALAVGFNREEAVTFADNSQSFVDASNVALSYSTNNHVKVVSKTVALNKTEIVEKLLEADFNFSLLWSCYRADLNSGSHCGRCESCQRLKRALTNARGNSRLKQKALDQLFKNL